MNSITRAAGLMALIMLTGGGCDEGGATSSAAKSTGSGDYGAPPPPAPAPAATSSSAPGGSAVDNATAKAAVPPSNSASASAQPAADPNVDRKKAEVGVGRKGQGYGGGIITEPVRQRFRIEEHIVFNIQIPHELQLYKAAHDNKGPRSSQEFFKEIIDAARLKLPDLNPGERYVYDPKTEELMVEFPDPNAK